MIIQKYAVLIWAFLLATAAVAGEGQRTLIEIAVDDDDAGQQSFMFDSEDAGFDLQSLAVGETRTVTDASGNVANISRTGDGFEIEVAGETMILGDPGVDDAHAVDVDTDVMIEGNKEIKIVKTGDADTVTIISSGTIDEATRQQIRAALASSGNENEIEFIDTSGTHADGAHKEVRVIRKEIKVTN